MYFSVSDSPNHDVNPFEEISAFLNATVGDLTWGSDAATRKASKARFCDKFLAITDLYDFEIPRHEVLNGLEKESTTNKDLVTHLASVGKFPEN